MTHLEGADSPLTIIGLGSRAGRRTKSTRGLNHPTAPGSGRVGITSFIDQIDLSIWFFSMDDEDCSQLRASTHLGFPGVMTGIKPLIGLVAYVRRSETMEEADRLAGRDLESWGVATDDASSSRTGCFQAVA